MDAIETPPLSFSSPIKWMRDETWRSLLLQDDVVHIWAFDLHSNELLSETLKQSLSNEEILRSQRFLRARDRVDYVNAHGVLRSVLSWYCDTSPAQIRFRTGGIKKPSLDLPENAVWNLSFNLSHCAGRMLLAITSGAQVGVDLECERDDIDILTIAEHYFRREELELIRSSNEESRKSTFFRYWVAKEALLKAHGVGLGWQADNLKETWIQPMFGKNERFSDRHQSSCKQPIQHLRCDSGWHAAVSVLSPRWSSIVQMS